MPKEEAPVGRDESAPIEEGAVEKEGVDEPPYAPVVEPVAPEFGEPESDGLEPAELEPAEPKPVKSESVKPDPVASNPSVIAEEGLAGREGVDEADDLEAGFEHAPRARAKAMTTGRENDLSFIFVCP